MVITLRGISLTNQDLPRLCGERIINLGGPQYPVDFQLTTPAPNLTETEFPRTLTLTRTGNTASAIEVFLSFTGSAALDDDYTVADAIEAGELRRVDFGAGQTSATFDIQPIQDLFEESEEIIIAIAPSPQVTSLPDGANATLALEDAPQVLIEALVDIAQRQGAAPGVIRISRTGPTGMPLEVKLDFAGSARNGEDYEQLNPTVVLESGSQSTTLELTPSAHAFDKNKPKVAYVSVRPDTTRYATISPWSASVLFLDKVFSRLHEYGSFEAALAPEFLVGQDADNDLIPLFMEYALGTDATSADSISIAQTDVFVRDGRFVISIATQSALTDVQIQPQIRIDATWTDISDGFDKRSYSASNERVVHEFISHQPVSEWQTTGIYRLAFFQTTPDNRETRPGALLGVSNNLMLARGDYPWTPSLDGAGMVALPRPPGAISTMTLRAGSTDEIDFNYSITPDSGATLKLLVNGATVQTWTDSSGSGSFSHNHNQPQSKIEFVLEHGPNEMDGPSTVIASVDDVALR